MTLALGSTFVDALDVEPSSITNQYDLFLILYTKKGNPACIPRIIIRILMFYEHYLLIYMYSMFIYLFRDSTLICDTGWPPRDSCLQLCGQSVPDNTVYKFLYIAYYTDYCISGEVNKIKINK